MPKTKVRAKGKADPEKTHVTLPVKWHIPDSIVTRFATNMLVQLIENEFKVMFFEMKPAIRLDPLEALPTEINADCVASVIIPADRMPKFIAAMQKQLQAYEEKRQDSKLL